MLKISSVGKYLDQPLLTAKIKKNIPTILTLGCSALVLDQIKNSPKEDRKKIGLKSSIILGSTILSAVNASKIASFITKRELPKSINEIKKYNTEIISNYLSKNKFETNIEQILTKAKDKILSVKEIDKLNTKQHSDILKKLIPPPENIKAKDIFKDIGWLSIFGAIPVAGGLVGGIVADKLTEKNWKQKIPNKINEGIYQYLANIFLCNVGAGIALGILEKCNIKSKAARCIGMVTGIMITGVIGGSTIANYIGKKFINPILSPNKQQETRTPELLDIGLHTDDIATVAVLSGLKWIEPSLPLLYSISGYRAGIGYRNKHNKNNINETNKQQAHFLRSKC